jgi:zinc finger BED domain-containing protein 4
LIFLGTQPFSIVENLGFQALIKLAFPDYEFPGRIYFTTYVADLSEKLRENVKDKLREAEIVHFKSDLTTLNDNCSYITITSNFINNAG